MSFDRVWRNCLPATLLATAVLSGAASAQPATFMAVGRQVVPPRGYLDFCAREPSECPDLKRVQAMADAAAPAEGNYWRLLFASLEPAAAAPSADVRLQPLSHNPWADAERAAGGEDTQASGAEGALPLTPTLWRELSKVNRSINRRIRSIPDYDVYGQNDFWAVPLKGRSRYGDCEDYALEKRRALRNRGYSERVLSIALVRTRWGQDHAVLLVRTDQGEMVLDSLSPWVRPWTEVGYAWMTRQSPLDPSVWVTGPRAGA